MKNATKHSENVKSLYKKLLKEGKPEPKQTVDALRALVMGTLAADVPDSRVDAAMAVIDKEFVSLNELRVATELEVISLIGEKYPDIEHRALVLKEMLNHLFEKEHTLNLERFKTLGRKEARAALRELPEITPFIEAYTMLFGFDEPVVPIDAGMLEVLQAADAVEPETTLDDAQKFVDGQIKGDDSHDFYAVLRRAAFKRGK